MSVAAIVGAQTLFARGSMSTGRATLRRSPSGLPSPASSSARASCSASVARGDDLEPLPATLALAGTGVALLTAARLLEDRIGSGHRAARGRRRLGRCLARAAGARPLARVRRRLLAFALIAVATADLLSDDALALAWAAQAILLSALAGRLRDARLQVGGLVYLALASGQSSRWTRRPRCSSTRPRADATPAVAVRRGRGSRRSLPG